MRAELQLLRAAMQRTRTAHQQELRLRSCCRVLHVIRFR